MPPRYRGRRPSRNRRSFDTADAPSASVQVLEAPDRGEVALPPALTVRELAELLDLPGVEIIKVLLKNGMMANINQTVDFDTAAIVAADLGFEPTEAPAAVSPREERAARQADEDTTHLRPRPPVVAVLGHVDHGKTSLLDAIRETNVTEGEAGGITQHIGAYQVEVDHQKVTFLDTPGHEAFTAMRARGANATDVAVIVVAADDGVMPQTVEAIDHARAAGVPIVVAVNKMDRPDADAEKVKRQLADHNVLIEEWGGDTVLVPVSARTREGLPDLLEHILLVAELEDLKANPNRRAEGLVIEAQLDPQRGPTTTVLVQTGTLRIGDIMMAGEAFGRVRAMYDDHNHQVKRAEPSTPVKILGLSTLPQAGDIFVVPADERTARTLAQERQKDRQQREAAPLRAVSLQDLFDQAQAGKIKELNVVLKTDVQGSIEPIRASLLKLGTEGLRVKVLHALPGNITESDVMLALASKGIVLAFNTRPEPGARRMADQEGVEIRTYDVIYNLVEDVELALKGMLDPVMVEVVEGHAEVRQVFVVGRRNSIGGSYILDGKAVRSAMARVIRGGNVVATSRVSGLKRFKDDAREVLAGFECGVTLDDFNDFQVGDQLEFYRLEREA